MKLLFIMEKKEQIASIVNSINNCKLYSEIMEYCELNNIKNVDKFVNDCLLSGFNIVRYGNSPFDNIKRQNGETQKKSDDNFESQVMEEPKVIKVKKKITIKNKY